MIAPFLTFEFFVFNQKLNCSPIIHRSVVILYETSLPGMAPFGLEALVIIGLNSGPLVDPELFPWWYMAFSVNCGVNSYPRPSWKAFLITAVAGVEKKASSGLIGFEL